MQLIVPNIRNSVDVNGYIVLPNSIIQTEKLAKIEKKRKRNLPIVIELMAVMHL